MKKLKRLQHFINNEAQVLCLSCTLRRLRRASQKNALEVLHQALLQAD